MLIKIDKMQLKIGSQNKKEHVQFKYKKLGGIKK